MATRVIRIIKGYPDGTLDLSDHGHTKAKKRDTIIWQIDPHSGVNSIKLIEKKPKSREIFSTPPAPHGANWRGDISSTVPPLATYRYSIYWQAETTNEEHEYDPIISIKPSLSLVLALISLVLGIFCISLLFWRKKKSANNLANIYRKPLGGTESDY